MRQCVVLQIKKIFSNHKFDKDELKIIDEVLKDEAKGDTECHILT